ncbi:MAG: hypothetical protein R3A44_25420 [Caldilineaceae bacterium]
MTKLLYYDDAYLQEFDAQVVEVDASNDEMTWRWTNPPSIPAAVDSPTIKAG